MVEGMGPAETVPEICTTYYLAGCSTSNAWHRAIQCGMLTGMPRMIALLRGVNVGGHRKVPMGLLRRLAEGARLTDVETYIQSGNLVFTFQGAASAAADRLRKAIATEVGFAVDVVVRTAVQWERDVTGNPFSDAAKERPNLLHLALSATPLAAGAAAALCARAGPEERIEQRGEVLWIDFGKGVGKSRLTPAVLDLAAGSPLTLRNWNTVLKLADLVRKGAPSR
jgi:uncharacterized protein (DUF1697 family)